MGYSKEVPKGEIDYGCENHFYLPHHAVSRELTTITKLRVVFDSSAKMTTRVSLNGILIFGPLSQPNIFVLLI